jgi:hypothetical protein
MRIDHGGAHLLVPKQLLDGPNVVPILKEMRGKGMAERAATGRLGDPDLAGETLAGQAPHSLGGTAGSVRHLCCRLDGDRQAGFGAETDQVVER